MLHQPTIEKLLAMRMEPMVETWRSFEQDEGAQQLSFEEKLSLMVDRLWTWRQNLALERRLRYAKLRGNACVEDIDYRTATKRARPSSLRRFPSLNGTNRSATSRSPTASSTVWCTTLIASNCAANPCVKLAPRNRKASPKPESRGFYTNWGRGRDSYAVPSSALLPARNKKTPERCQGTNNRKPPLRSGPCPAHKTDSSQVSRTANRRS